MSAVRTQSGDQPGCACLISATAPAVCGQAKLVPLARIYLVGSNMVPVLVSAAPTGTVAERIFTPGALTSGLIWPNPETGPRELKSAIDGANTSAALIRTCFAETPLAPMIDFKYSPFTFDKPTVGITDLRTVVADNSPSVLL